MNGIVEAETEKYLYSLLPRRDAVLREMERYAARHSVPIVGPACGRMLYQLASLVGARRVFEMGSAIGYSTLWLARAVGPKGIVYYTDGDPANARAGAPYWVIHRADLQAALADAVREHPDIELKLGCQFEDLAPHAKGLTIVHLPGNQRRWNGDSGGHGRPRHPAVSLSHSRR